MGDPGNEVDRVKLNTSQALYSFFPIHHIHPGVTLTMIYFRDVERSVTYIRQGKKVEILLTII